MNNQQLEDIAKQAHAIADANNYRTHQSTAKSHAKIQSYLVETNTELIRTIRTLDSKNSKLQKQVALLSVVATFASIVALFK